MIIPNGMQTFIATKSSEYPKWNISEVHGKKGSDDPLSMCKFSRLQEMVSFSYLCISVTDSWQVSARQNALVCLNIKICFYNTLLISGSGTALVHGHMLVNGKHRPFRGGPEWDEYTCPSVDSLGGGGHQHNYTQKRALPAHPPPSYSNDILSAKTRGAEMRHGSLISCMQCHPSLN